MLSFRFGPSDGVSVEARKWAWALGQLGFATRWVAGDGDDLDVRIDGLGIDARREPDRGALRDAVRDCDLVVVENLLSLPLNPRAQRAVADVLRGVRTVVHHHDLPWQRPQFASAPPPPDDRAWAHVTINELSRSQLATHGIESTTLYNRFDRPLVTGVAVPEHRRPLLLHPTRAIPRKDVPAAVRLAEELGGTYWLLGPSEDGYEAELREVLAAARCDVVREGGVPVGDAYRACDLVVYPSTWEGFGNATIESALARRPLAVGRYPVVDELLRFGFRWFSPTDVEPIRAWLASPDADMLDTNEAIALEHFALSGLPAALAPVLERVL